jgi:hypothetical protein
VSAPKAAAVASPASGSFDWASVAALLVPSLLAFITCVAETKGSEAAFGAVHTLVDALAVPWATYLEQSTASGSAAKPATVASAVLNHMDADTNTWSSLSVKQFDTLGKLKFKTAVQWHALTATPSSVASTASATVAQLRHRVRLARLRFDAIALVLCASATAPDLAFALPQLCASLAYANKVTADLFAGSPASSQAEATHADPDTDAVSEWLLAAHRLASIWRARLSNTTSSSALPSSLPSASTECAMFLLQLGTAARQHLPPRHSTAECIALSITDFCRSMGDSGSAPSALHECVTLLAAACASSSVIALSSTVAGNKVASTAVRRVAAALPSDANASAAAMSVESIIECVSTIGARVRAMVAAASAASAEARGQYANAVQMAVLLLQEAVALLNKRLKQPNMYAIDCNHHSF